MLRMAAIVIVNLVLVCLQYLHSSSDSSVELVLLMVVDLLLSSVGLLMVVMIGGHAGYHDGGGHDNHGGYHDGGGHDWWPCWLS